jgi:hypothetical protein
MINARSAPCDAGVVNAAGRGAACDRRTRFWIMAATGLGSAMAFIDGSAVNVALPALERDLGCTLRHCSSSAAPPATASAAAKSL